MKTERGFCRNSALICLRMQYFNWKTIKIAKHWGLRLQIPIASWGWGLRPQTPIVWPWTPELRVCFPVWIREIPYAPACHCKYTSSILVQTFYSFILIRVNKEVLPLHNLPFPKKVFGWLRACSVLSMAMHKAYVHLLIIKWLHASMLWRNNYMFVFYNHNVYKHTEPNFWRKIKRTVLRFANHQ